MKVLVAYESKYGATQGIAERIGEALRQRGLDVHVARCRDVDDAAGYDAYIVGSATYEFNWRRRARDFVEHNADLLSQHPTWLFSSGPVGTDKVDDKGKDVLEGAAPRQFAKYDELIHPRGTQVFRGAYHHDLLRGTDRILTWMPAISDILPEGDFREWDAIDTWADAVADELGAASRTSG
jgi:menaquinone-dependent protoporphyrinogen oxidase